MSAAKDAYFFHNFISYRYNLWLSRTKGKYGEDGQDRFTYTQALVLVQCLLNAPFAYVLRGKTRDNVPVRNYAFVAMSYLLAMVASNHALQYIPYPTQVI